MRHLSTSQRLRRLCSSSAVLAAFVIAGCGDDPVAPGSTAIRVAAVTVTPATVQLTALGQTAQLSATATSAAGTTVGHKGFVWSSSDPTVVSVSAEGVVESEGAGVATVTATTDGKSGTASISVVLGG